MWNGCKLLEIPNVTKSGKRQNPIKSQITVYFPNLATAAPGTVYIIRVTPSINRTEVSDIIQRCLGAIGGLRVCLATRMAGYRWRFSSIQSCAPPPGLLRAYISNHIWLFFTLWPRGHLWWSNYLSLKYTISNSSQCPSLFVCHY